MTAPVVAAWEENTVGSGSTSLTIEKPTGTAEGDWIIIFAAQRNNPAPTLTGPSGFTAVEQLIASQTTVGCWYKQAGASEPSTYTVTSNRSQEYCVAAMRITGGDSTDALENSDISGYSAATTFTAPGVTTSVADCLILRYCAKKDGTVTITSPGDHTELFSTTIGASQFPSHASAWENFASTGDCGSADFSLSGTTEGCAVTVAFKAPAGGGATIPIFDHHYRSLRSA